MKYLYSLFLLISASLLHSSAVYTQQENSIQSRQSGFYSNYRKIFKSEEDFDKLNFSFLSNGGVESATLNKQVFGWVPYWIGTAYTGLNYNLLSTAAYFSYEVDPATGGYTTINFWRTTNLVPLAHANNIKVVLTATNFGSANNTALLGNASSRQRLIDSLFALVKFRGADGVNIDFELVPASQKNNLTSFMTALANKFHTGIPGSKISIALPAVDWNGSFDVPALNNICDQMLIMGYDYYWSSAPNAGPVAPLQSGSVWTPYNVTSSVNYYINSGASASKLMLAVPYYGYQWPTANSNVNSATTGTGTAYVYSSMKTKAQTYGRLWDANSSTPWYRYNSSGWNQGWYDDSVSLAAKYDLTISKHLGGIGIWALTYDGSNKELWNLIASKFGGSVGINNINEGIPGYRLQQNYPNPFNPVTRINYELKITNYVSLRVYDIAGKMIKELVNEKQEAGSYSVRFDGSGLASGVYFYRLEAGDFTETRKMIIVK